MRVFLDFETRSRQDLRKVGVYKYAECPDFEILMCAWAEQDSEIWVTVGKEDTNTTLRRYLDEGVEFCAHNAQFERITASASLGMPLGKYLDPEYFHDSAALAAEYGHPVSLDAVSKALGAPPKDAAGKNLIKIFCMPNRAGGWNDATTHPMEWLDFINYCAQDVDTLRAVAQRLGGWPTEMERKVWNADQRVNDTGMFIDVPMAKLAQKASEANREEQMQEAMGLTNLLNPNSIQQLTGWFKEQEVEIPDLKAETVQLLLEGDTLDEPQRRVLEIRQDLALAAAGKYTAALDTVSPDGRVRGGFKFFGAHTGRWAGRGLQPHNLPRLAFKTELEAEVAILDLKLGNPTSQEDLKKLVRPLFVGPFTVVDYASIEARVVAWLAGEQWALEAFRKGRDIYVETAERMGGLTRAQGKIAVLALGYNGGINSLKNLGAEDDDEVLQGMVNVWRKANKRIVTLWADLGNAIEEGGKVGPHLRITRHGGSMKMHLPSGRAIHYHHVRWDTYRVPHPITPGKTVVKQSWRYDDPKKPGVRIGTYGGRMVENATQAVARDILAEALVRLYEEGYTVAGHVHDEIIVEGRHDVDLITKIMCEPPSWSTGMPIDGAGFVCDRYRKG